MVKSSHREINKPGDDFLVDLFNGVLISVVWPFEAEQSSSGDM